MLKQLNRLLLSVVPLAIPATSMALSNSGLGNFESFPQLPRATLAAYGGSYGVGKGDVMVPIYGNDKAVVFLDVQGAYGPSSFQVGSFGAGYRQVTSADTLWGGYAFMDYTKTSAGKRFWIFSPGIERLGTVWDFRANAYIPVSAKRALSHTGWADELGIPGYTYFVDHTKYGQRFNVYQEIGTGADVEVGRTIAGIQGLKAYAGSYYYQMKSTANVKGVNARLEYAVNPRMSLLVSNQYDNNRHNILMLGVKLTLGGLSQRAHTSTDIHKRLLDPIERNTGAYSATKQVAQPAPNSVPSEIEQEKIYFFDPNGAMFDPSLGKKNCTIDHPCSNFEQSTVDGIRDLTSDAILYFRPGGYLMNQGNQISLAAGQSMWGRTVDYLAPAQGQDRALLQGSMRLLGRNYLNALRFERFNDQNTVGITIKNADKVVFDQVDIGSGSLNYDYFTALKLNNAHDIVFKNGEMNTYRDSGDTYGINMVNSSLSLSNSGIYSGLIRQNQDITPLTIAGIYAKNSSLQIRNSQISVKGEMQGDFYTYGGTVILNTYGINAVNSDVDVRDSTFRVHGFLECNSLRSFGIRSTNGGSLTALNNRFNIKAITEFSEGTRHTVAEAWGIYAGKTVQRNPGISPADVAFSTNEITRQLRADTKKGKNVNIINPVFLG